MKGTILVILLLAATALLLSGCTDSSEPPGSLTPVTTVPTMSPVITPTITQAIADYLTGPMPGDKSVAISVDRSAVNPNITITFRGGAGINFVATMDTLLTRSDGVVMQDSLSRPRVNDHITMVGTKEVSETRADRLQVFITLVTGDKYLIYDQTLPYKSRG
ncbi:MAG TPA: hypothetical protein PK272_06205 [Methanoregulaceae archaeon]|nr:hypothetical protein [Burkholderiaceae bacterium]HMZ30988.1 hypothetical protein [Methanoregulaceae archaeon]HNI42249.1 hypothetical protein [Methanoregulaceae archaeon]HNJ80262.1 hypothetical protein [Methanoregulaceae archaeon]HNO07305.1 hypothetical protein [Methanoregulaceae archaeon]